MCIAGKCLSTVAYHFEATRIMWNISSKVSATQCQEIPFINLAASQPTAALTMPNTPRALRTVSPQLTAPPNRGRHDHRATNDFRVQSPESRVSRGLNPPLTNIESFFHRFPKMINKQTISVNPSPGLNEPWHRRVASTCCLSFKRSTPCLGGAAMWKHPMAGVFAWPSPTNSWRPHALMVRLGTRKAPRCGPTSRKAQGGQ